ncbi:helix-turn-helix transcriptional regulator [Acrocarpospora sp. B8E8]|uniref:helix-turn-helix domain-containing protein n=1 Tax=Acrocarpospora sp. B8E8 TaxID=3153572 RepID=UPI00325F0AA8
MGTHDALWDSARARALIASRNLGGAIRLARESHGWRQADLGRATGYSASTISRLETGHRVCADVDILIRVARAVALPTDLLSVFLGIPAEPPAAAGADRAEENPVRRRSFIAAAGLTVPLPLLTRLDDALVLLPTPARPATPAGLAQRLARARRQFDAGDLAGLVAELPDLIATAHYAAEQGDGPAVHAGVADCYMVATEALDKIGHHGASRITADRAASAARLSESPIAAAAAARCMSIVLRHEGRHRIADQVIMQAAGQVEATGLVTSAQAATYAQILCTSAYIAAQVGDRDRALELIGEAERAAARLPSQPIASQPFTVSPAAVGLYKVGVHWSLGDAGAALTAGRGLRASMFPSPERRGRLHTDLARAWWQWGKPEQTARELLAACRHAPGEVRDRLSIRKIAVELVQRHPKVVGVPELAAAVRAARQVRDRPSSR